MKLWKWLMEFLIMIAIFSKHLVDQGIYGEKGFKKLSF